jgi:hypothetical protein
MLAEVKGTWFVTLRTWSERELPDALPALAAAMPVHGHVILEPAQGEWYPEDALLELFVALWDYLDHDRDRFIEVSRQISHEAVGRFFRVLLGLSSAGFLLKQVPTMWRRLRRGDAATVTVSAAPGASLVRYSGFPWFDHEVYVLFTLGSLTALAELAEPERGDQQPVELVARGPGMAEFRVPHR